MKHLSIFCLLSVLNGALAGSNDPASGCVMTSVLPTVTVGCSEALPSATQFYPPLGTQQPGHESSSPINVQPGQHSSSPGIAQPGVDHPGTQSLTGVPSKPTSGSGRTSGSRPVINGGSGSNGTHTAPGTHGAPTIVSGASVLMAHVSVEMVVASLLACFMPMLIERL
ncbi:uncharacterized protein FMAN_09892 [Fusarium mangiferae]|uniref:Uncharacterized protein n=1 Tax=Fusarium mangiferae TaxID=192010 RepID=A0A1L7TYV3_FUSMA|nr:uncharacterized protein FMAN_09892 [Fusarium mangiferae]CVL00451.1 uncharacterized protein FMAN_09892 [Fusarium mangiferae]